MAKRFTDSEKWDRPWFRRLSPKLKCLWAYITDKCDIAGVWYVDLELASIFIGEKVDPAEALVQFEKQIRVVDNSRWLIVDFVRFQYGVLKGNNNLHRSVIARLEALKSGADQPLPSPSSGAKDKDKDKEKVSSEEKGSGEEKPPKADKPLTPIQVCVEVWKQIEGVVPSVDEMQLLNDEEKAEVAERSKAWDKVYYPRHTRAAKQLLSLLGSPEETERCMEAIVNQMRGKSLSYTIETVVKHASTWSREQAADAFKRMAESRG